MIYNTETSKRLFRMNPSCSQSTFRDSARQALQANKNQDGSLNMSTPFHDVQAKKVAHMKQKLSQLNSINSSVRCQSHLNESSAASVTAATSYINTNAVNTKQGYQFRPNSNNSFILESSNNRLGRNNTFITDLNKETNVSEKDCSPMRVSNLGNNSRGVSRGRSGQLDSKKIGTQSAIQNPMKRSNMRSQIADGYSPMYIQQRKTVRNFEQQQKARNSSTSGERNNKVNRSASFHRGGSVASIRTNQSSPERLVNIVCPPSRGPKNRNQGKRIISQATRPRSDMRHKPYNSFMSSEYDRQEKLKKGFKQMKALGGSFGISNSSQSQFVSNKRLTLAKKKLQTPTKAGNKRSRASLSCTKSKSRSHSRLGGCRSSQQSTPVRSRNASNNKLIMRKNSKIISQKQHVRKQSASKLSTYSRSVNMNSTGKLSNNSNNIAGLRSDGMKTRDERRADKYHRNQMSNTTSVKKAFNFSSIENEYNPSGVHEDPKKSTGEIQPRSGQITGKFRSLNDHTMKLILNKNNQEVQEKLKEKTYNNYNPLSYKRPQTGYQHTEDDYAETLTASSEESPMRPSQRVQRAAALTTKAYLEDVNQRVENANHHANSIKEFGPRKMKVAYQGINQRQGARLQAMKAQMQESLIETHELQAKLQSSACDDKQVRKGGVSQFNSLVLEFSQNLEDKAQQLIMATESKRKNQKMREMITELQEIRKVRSGSKSAPGSSRHRNSSLKKSRRGSGKKLSTSRSRSKSRQSRSRNRSTKKMSTKRSRSTKKLRNKTKSKSKSKSISKSKTKSMRSSRSKRSRSRRSMSCSGKSIRSGKLVKSNRSARSGRSGRSASSRGRSRSLRRSNKVGSVKRNIFKSTNGFTDLGNSSQLTLGMVQSKTGKSRSKSRKSRKSRSKSARSNGRSLSRKSRTTKSYKRVKELGKKCTSLMTKKYDANDKALSAMIRSQRKRSVSRKKGIRSMKSSKSRSKSRKKIIGRKKSMSRSKSARKSKSRKGSKSPHQTHTTPKITPKITPQITPCMTPLHNILRNSMAGDEMSEIRNQMTRFGSVAHNKKVKIQSQRLQDLAQLSSSDSDSSYDSEDSLDNDRYLKRQQAHLSPWQRACIRKQLPKKFR